MKTKKLIVTLLIFVATIMLFTLANQTYAATAGIGKVNITAERTVNMPIKIVQPELLTAQSSIQTYKVKHQLFKTTSDKIMNVWKLIGKDEKQSSTDELKDLYCIRAGLGFGNTTGGAEYHPEDVDYTVGYELPKEFSNAKQFFEKDGESKVPVLTDENKDNFNKMMWILDHMLLEDATDAEARAYLVNHAGYTTQSFSESNFRENVLTRADIEVIQQLAIWYYTNADENAYHSDLYLNNTLQKLYLCIGEENALYDTEGEYQTLSDIYDTATSVICDHSCGTERQNAANLLFKYLIEGYDKEKGAESLNEDGIYVPTREIIVYVAGEATNQQPVVQVKETAEADIALRKFIYSVNGNKLEGNSLREPQVDTSKLNDIDQNGKKITTAIYNHPKTPVRVNIGDVITYTIRLYNEGEVEARIKNVKDTLPAYIQFEDSTQNGYWLSTNTSEVKTTEACQIVGAGGQLKFEEIKNKLLSEVVIPAAKLNEDQSDPTQKYILSYVDIQISGKVMTTAPYDTKLTNIAEVTEMTDKDGVKDLDDRDSKVTDEQEQKNGNATIPEETQKPAYKEDKENDPYVPGQEDDDDFEKVIVEAPTIDLALRKFISKVGTKEYNRAPVPDTTGLRNGTSTTAQYTHSKVPVRVKKGDSVTYTIRIYNEGEVAGKVKEVTDYIDKNLSYVAGGTDTNADWWKETDGAEYKTVVTTDKCLIVNVGGNVSPTYVGKTLGEAIIPAYDKERDVISYIDIEIHCKVLDEVLSGTKLTNITEITKEADEYDKLVEQDKDSIPNNVKDDEQKPDKFPDTEEEFPHFKEDKEKDTYVPGQEDDDDFEKVYIEEPIDLALRKYISKIGDTEYQRAPVVDTTPLLEAIENGTIEEGATAIYKHSKDPIKAKIGDIVTYKIRIYNEGLNDGRVSEITDHVDKNLRYVAGGRDENKTWWQEEEGEEYNTITSTDSCVVTAVGGNTSIADLGKHPKDVVIPAFDPDENVISYIEVEIHLQIQKVTEKIKLTNIAEITKEADETGREIEQDVDSIPDNVEQKEEFPNGKEEWPNYKEDEENKGPEGYVPGNEDDDDFEKVEVVLKFDLALRKFITKVQNTPVNNRYPRVTYSEDEDKLTYTHTKTPVEVVTGDTVIYTIRVYNEGEQAGYANEITDDVPEGLEFLLGNETNIEYRWKMLDENGEETEDPSKAKYIVTDYLSEEQEKETKRDNKLKAFDKELAITETNPDYRDVKVAFKVTYVAKTKDESARVLVNVAQISKDSDDDDDSIPNRDEEYKKDGDNEDDIDYDNVKVKYFDLSLLKWVAQTKVTLNGKETVTDTGHNAQNSKNEPPVKLEINSKDINKVVIKYVYTIQITNEGEIEGYATEITDYIPSGLRFEEADNTEWNWKVKADGVVTTDYLKETLLKPGESATVPIVLTWINSAENLGEKVNLAEISADDNPSDSPDVDSTPDNKVPEEDDIDDAPVVLATKTGAVQIYIGLISIILITFASGISLIKKYVLE